MDEDREKKSSEERGNGRMEDRSENGSKNEEGYMGAHCRAPGTAHPCPIHGQKSAAATAGQSDSSDDSDNGELSDVKDGTDHIDSNEGRKQKRKRNASTKLVESRERLQKPIRCKLSKMRADVKKMLKNIEEEHPQNLGKPVNTKISMADQVFKVRTADDVRNMAGEWKSMAEGKDEFNVEYIICSTLRECGSPVNYRNCMLLVKWDGYHTPSWAYPINIEDDGTVKADFRKRTLLLDLIEIELRREGRYNAYYPHRYLSNANADAVEGGYVTDEWALYKGHLRAIEFDWNRIHDKLNIADVFIEDHTRLTPDADTLRSIQWTVRNRFSEEVEKLFKKCPPKQLNELQQTERCRNCYAERKTAHATWYYCENHLQPRNGNKNGQARIVNNFENRLYIVECINKCECPIGKCNNQTIQTPRTKELVIFRHARRGWTLRTVHDYREGEVITELCGEITLEPCTGRAVRNNYCFGYETKRCRGKPRPLNLSSFTLANEARFIAQTCHEQAANVYFWAHYVERQYGFAVHRVGVVARRRIRAGEELAQDNFLDKDGKPAELQIYDASIFDWFPPAGCCCRSPDCRFTKAKLARYKIRCLNNRDSDSSGSSDTEAPKRKSVGTNRESRAHSLKPLDRENRREKVEAQASSKPVRERWCARVNRVGDEDMARAVAASLADHPSTSGLSFPDRTDPMEGMRDDQPSTSGLCFPYRVDPMQGMRDDGPRGSDQPASVMSMYDPDAFLVTHQLPLSGGEEDSASPVEYQPASRRSSIEEEMLAGFEPGDDELLDEEDPMDEQMNEEDAEDLSDVIP